MFNCRKVISNKAAYAEKIIPGRFSPDDKQTLMAEANQGKDELKVEFYLNHVPC
jgi:hypothetical protein